MMASERASFVSAETSLRPRLGLLEDAADGRDPAGRVRAGGPSASAVAARVEVPRAPVAVRSRARAAGCLARRLAIGAGAAGASRTDEKQGTREPQGGLHRLTIASGREARVEPRRRETAPPSVSGDRRHGADARASTERARSR